jgi:hypothetical protein
MNARRCLKIATRIGALLEREIGLGVDTQRMLTERLYMRDVLLVCDAHRQGEKAELAELATWFRRAAAEVPADGGPPSGFGLDSGFGPSGFGGSSTYDSQRDHIGALPTPAMLVRHQLEQQRAAARRGGWMSALRTGTR